MKALAILGFIVVANVLAYLIIVETSRNSYPKPDYVKVNF